MCVCVYFVFFICFMCYLFHVALLCFHVFNVAFICFMCFHVFQVFHVVFMCFMFSCVFIKLRDIMFIFAIFLAKKTPTSPVRPAWNAGFEGESRTCGGHFSQATPSGKLAVHIYIYIYIVSCCVRSLFHSELSCLHVFHGLSCLNLLNAYNLCFGSWFGVCGVFPIC